MSLLFSTEVVPLTDRLEAWLWNARQICGDCRFQFHGQRSFHGSIERRKIAGLELTLFSSSAVSFNKFPPAAMPSESRACIVITQLAGVRQYCQAGRVAVLQKGDTTLIDSGLPWSSDCAGDCARLYLRLPMLLAESRLRGSKIPTATAIRGGVGLGATLFQMAGSLYRESEVLTSEEGVAAIDAYLHILSGCIMGPSAGLGRDDRNATFARITEYINEHLTEATLCPAEIASATGISVRHLHRLFCQQGARVTNWIRVERLKQCRTDLSNPRGRARSITEIAFSWGFNDSAHFSHSFKKQFGISPRNFRSSYFPDTAKEEGRRPCLAHRPCAKVG